MKASTYNNKVLMITSNGEIEKKELAAWFNKNKNKTVSEVVTITNISNETISFISHPEQSQFRCKKCKDSGYIPIGTIVSECDCESSEYLTTNVKCVECKYVFEFVHIYEQSRLVHREKYDSVSDAFTKINLKCPNCNSKKLTLK